VEVLSFEILGVGLTVACDDAGLRSLLLTHYGRMRASPAGPTLAYRAGRVDDGSGYFYAPDGGPPNRVADSAALLNHFDGDVTIALERARPDLYFLHAAALVFDGAVTLLVAPSGGGKSISSWALTHHGFAYLSDELAPIDLRSVTVHAYTRALCLKRRPPDEYPLPPDAVFTSRTIHVPVDALPGGTADAPGPVRAMFFLHYRPDLPQGSLHRVTAGEAAARLYPNALNPLAHPGEGLQGALRVATTAAAYRLVTPDLGTTCRLIRSALAGLPREL
jgi:hypothetical protein